MQSIIDRIRREPALATGLIAAAIALGTSFGLDLSHEQVGSIMAVTVAILAIVTRQNVTPNISVAAEEAVPGENDLLVAGEAAKVPDGDPVEVLPAAEVHQVYPPGEDADGPDAEDYSPRH